MTPAEDSHLCACEILALAESGHCSRGELLAALRCIRNTLEKDIKPDRAPENKRRAKALAEVTGAKKKPRTVI